MKHFVCLGIFALLLCANPVSADYVIMPIGDSITSGYHGTNPGIYRDQLQTRLDNEGIAYDFVGQYQLGFKDRDHQGLGGASIEYMTENWGPVVGGYQPDFALVLAGTNNHFAEPDFDAFVSRYDDLINMIINNSPQTSIIISTVPKFGYDRVADPPPNYWTNAWVDNRNQVVIPNMNAAIYAVAANYANVEVVDFYSAIDISTDLTADAIHPNFFGHQKLAGLYGDEIMRQINVASVPEPGSGLVALLLLVGGLSRRNRCGQSS